MNELFSVVFPLLILCVIVFFVTRFWIAIVDAVAGVFKKIFGLKKKEARRWHTLHSEAKKDSNERRDGNHSGGN